MKEKSSRPKKVSKAPKIIFALGLIALATGGGLFAYKMLTGPATEDAEFLVTTKDWVREDQPGVIWSFTETGKGKLTTDNHATDYDFEWTLKDRKLSITTDWLYELSDTFDYSLDQGAKVLTIALPGQEAKVRFRAVQV